jgi:predicted ABC-type ATPase
MNDRSAPTIHILAGPNGAGKTTFAKSYLPTFADCREFLNADLIASGLAPFAPETQAARASELLLQRIEELVADRASFSFETTLSARTYRPAIVKWRRWGYRITLHFFWLPTVEMAIQRVAKRVREGGHGIPESVIRRRYTRGLLNLFELYLPIVSTGIIYDGAEIPAMPIAEIDDAAMQVLDYSQWQIILRQAQEARGDE